MLTAFGCLATTPAMTADFNWPAKDFTCSWQGAKRLSFEEAFLSAGQFYGLCVRFRALAGPNWLLTKKLEAHLDREPMAAIWGPRTPVPTKPINVEAVGWLMPCAAARDQGQNALDAIDPEAVELMSGPCHYQDGPVLFVSDYHKIGD